ncbi:hypothetical protein JCM10207_000112 [Rhodosporidiobolus poonsookiae]
MATTVRPSLSTRRTSSTTPASFAASPSVTTARNPLHLKVHRLLSANWDDQATRSALDTLGTLDLDSQPSSTPSDPPTSTSTSSTKPRSLRKHVDSQLAQGSRAFLAAFSTVNDHLSSLDAHLASLHAGCDAVQLDLDRANSATRYLLEHAQGLRTQRATAQLQGELTHLFLERFTLGEEELRALTDREVPVGPRLFQAMDKTERIRDDCRALLSGEAGEGTQAGLDIMLLTSRHLDAGFAKLHKWLLFEARGFARDVLEVSATVREAVRRLKGRPEMLSEVLTLLGTTRSSAILNLFLDALTRGGSSSLPSSSSSTSSSANASLPRPIELHAHDPLRYVGDMLAWLHQSMAGEREFLESLFGLKDDAGEDEREGGRRVGEVHAWSRHRRTKTEVRLVRGETDRDRVRRLLDKDFEGCGRPLKIRVQQTIKSQESPIVSYRIAALIHFYKVTMERTVGEDALMSTVLGEIMDHAYSAFFDILAAQGRALLRFVQPPAAALSPPPALLDALHTLREIALVYSQSLLDASDLSPSRSSSSRSAERESTFAPVLSAALDPALALCDATAAHRPAQWDRAVFGINCRVEVLEALKPFADGEDAFCRARYGEVVKEVERLKGELADEHASQLLQDAGLAPLLAALHATPPEPLPMPALTALPPTLSAFLSALDPSSAPRLALLPAFVAAEIQRASLRRVGEAYEEVYDAAEKEGNGRGMRGREEVWVLLGVEREER